MEKFLVKTGIYSFIVSFSLLFVFLPRTRSTTDVNGMTSGMVIPYPEYFFNITRYSIITSIVALVVMYFVHQLKKIKNESNHN